MEIAPCCIAREVDVDVNSGCCLGCGLHPDSSLELDQNNPEIQAINERIVFRWIRSHKLEFMRVLPSLLSVTSNLYQQTNTKFIILSFYDSVFELVHTPNLQMIPIETAEQEPLLSIAKQVNLFEKIEKLKPNEEVLLWTVVRGGSTNNLPIMYDDQGNPLEALREDPMDIEDMDSLLDNDLEEDSLALSTASILNMTAAAKILECEKTYGTDRIAQACCCVCLDLLGEYSDNQIERLKPVVLTCGHMMHQGCVPQLVKIKHQCPFCDIKVTIKKDMVEEECKQ